MESSIPSESVVSMEPSEKGSMEKQKWNIGGDKLDTTSTANGASGLTSKTKELKISCKKSKKIDEQSLYSLASSSARSSPPQNPHQKTFSASFQEYKEDKEFEEEEKVVHNESFNQPSEANSEMVLPKIDEHSEAHSNLTEIA